MNLKQMILNPLVKHYPGVTVKNHNDLKIDQIKIIKNTQTRRMIVLIESAEGFTKDLDLSLNEAKLIIQDFIDPEREKPIHTHLIEKDVLYEFNNGGYRLGFSEILLPRNYSYEVQNFKILNPYLLKVILGFEKNNKKNLM